MIEKLNLNHGAAAIVAQQTVTRVGGGGYDYPPETNLARCYLALCDELKAEKERTAAFEVLLHARLSEDRSETKVRS
jgi:hypothetical protein